MRRTAMILVVLILAPAAGAGWEEFWGGGSRASASDLAFAYAVEDSVRAGLADRHGGLRLEAVLGPREARLVRGLGCGKHGCRETALDALAALGAKADRAIIWGSFSRDDEVAERCWVLLEARGLTFPCWHCSGPRGAWNGCPVQGMCGVCRTWEPVDEGVWAGICRVCWGRPVKGGRKAPR